MPTGPVDRLSPVLERLPDGAEGITLTDRQREALRRHILNVVDPEMLSPFGDEAEMRRRTLLEEIRGALEAGVVPEITRAAVSEELIRAFYARTLGLGPLETLLADDEVIEITVTAPESIVIRRENHTLLWPQTFRDREHLRRTIETLALRMGRSLNYDHPALDMRLPDPPMRLHASLFGLHGPVFALRRGRRTSFSMDYMVRTRVLDEDMAAFLRNLVRIPVSIIFAGVVGTGKTTVLETVTGVLREEHPDRIVMICEDTVEIAIEDPQVLHQTLAALPGHEHRLTDLVHHALRCNTQLLVVGEVRSSAEAHALLYAASSMTATYTTLHGRAPREALQRLLMLLEGSGEANPLGGAARSDVCRVVADLFPVVVLTDQLPDGRFVVREIAWVDVEDGDFALTPIFEIDVTLKGSRPTYIWRRIDDFTLPAHFDERLRLHVAEQQRLRMQHLLRQTERVRTLIRRREWPDVVDALDRLLRQDPSLFEVFAADFETALRQTGDWERIEYETRATVKLVDARVEAGDWEAAHRTLDEFYTPAHRLVWSEKWQNWQRRIHELRETDEVLENITARARRLQRDGHLLEARELLEQVNVTALTEVAHTRWRRAYADVLRDVARETDDGNLWRYLCEITADAVDDDIARIHAEAEARGHADGDGH